MASLFFGGSKLHREIEESFFVPLRVALNEPYQLLCRRHVLSLYDLLRANYRFAPLHCV